jgi:hypothetical protein
MPITCGEPADSAPHTPNSFLGALVGVLSLEVALEGTVKGASWPRAVIENAAVTSKSHAPVVHKRPTRRPQQPINIGTYPSSPITRPFFD